MKVIRTTLEERAGRLRTSSLFAALPGQVLRELVKHAEMRTFEAGEHVFIQDTAAHGFYIVDLGQVRIYRLSPDGREQVLHLFGPGEACGEVPVFQGGTYPATASATTVARLLYIEGRHFTAIAHQHPEMLLKMLAALSIRLRQFVGLIDDLSLKEVSARIAKVLLDTSSQYRSTCFELPTTKILLAARVGTAPETLSRTLKKMQKKQMIDVSGRSITIINRDALVDVAAGDKL